MSTRKPTRLSKQDWLLAGFAALGEVGPSALKAEPLARRLGTTKGSFYWHFADLPAFHAAILHQWEARAIPDIVEGLSEAQTDVARLRRFGQIIAEKSAPSGKTGDAPDSGLGVEPAFRAWALSDPDVAAAVARVDGQRLTYLCDLLRKVGISNAEMARIIYATSIGMDLLGDANTQDNTAAMGSLVDLVLALR